MALPIAAADPKTMTMTIVDRQDHGGSVVKHVGGNSFGAYHSATMQQSIEGHTLTLLLPNQPHRHSELQQQVRCPRGLRQCAELPGAAGGSGGGGVKGRQSQVVLDASIDGSKRKSETYFIQAVK